MRLLTHNQLICVVNGCKNNFPLKIVPTALEEVRAHCLCVLKQPMKRLSLPAVRRAHRIACLFMPPCATAHSRALLAQPIARHVGGVRVQPRVSPSHVAQLGLAGCAPRCHRRGRFQQFVLCLVPVGRDVVSAHLSLPNSHIQSAAVCCARIGFHPASVSNSLPLCAAGSLISVAWKGSHSSFRITSTWRSTATCSAQCTERCWM